MEDHILPYFSSALINASNAFQNRIVAEPLHLPFKEILPADVSEDLFSEEVGQKLELQGFLTSYERYPLSGRDRYLSDQA